MNDKFKIHIKIYRWGGSDAMTVYFMSSSNVQCNANAKNFVCHFLCVSNAIACKGSFNSMVFTRKGKFCVCLNSSLELSLK